MLVGTESCLEKFQFLVRLQILNPERDAAFIVADIGDVFSVGADARFGECAVLAVFQRHRIVWRVLQQC